MATSGGLEPDAQAGGPPAPPPDGSGASQPKPPRPLRIPPEGKAQPRACGAPVAKRTLAELKADEKKTGIKVPEDLPPDFPRGPWVVDMTKPADHVPATGAHDGGARLPWHAARAERRALGGARWAVRAGRCALAPRVLTHAAATGWKYQEEQMVVQWKCWCSDPNTPLESPGLDLNKYNRGGQCHAASADQHATRCYMKGGGAHPLHPARRTACGGADAGVNKLPVQGSSLRVRRDRRRPQQPER